MASARLNEKGVLPGLGVPAGRVGIGDRNDWSPELRDRLAAGRGTLLAPSYQKSRDPDRRRSAEVGGVRDKIETVNGQLAERYNIKRTWAKDLWHLCHRVIRKLLSHTVALVLTARTGHLPLQCDALAS